MKKHSSISKSGVSVKEVKPMRRESQDVMAELVAQLRKRLTGERFIDAVSDEDVADWERPNLDRLTVGVDVGDQWSNYCILGLGGETLAEGQFRSKLDDVGEFFAGVAGSRVVMEVGTHSAWMREVIVGLGHEVR